MTLKTEFYAAADAGSRRLMVVLHGLGDSSAGYRWLPQLMRLPWMNYLLVNAPDDYYGGYSWYDFAGNPGPGVARSVRMLNEVLDVQRSGGYPTEETTLFGFSQGCLMTMETGLRYPHRFAGLVGISGYLHDHQSLITEKNPVALQQRILMTHGTLDPLIPIAAPRQQAHLLKQAGFNIEWLEFQKVHTIDDRQEIPALREFIVKGYPAGNQ